MVRKITPAVSSPNVQTHQAGCAPRVPLTHTGCCGCSAVIGVSSLCRNLQHHPPKRAVRVTGSKALLLPQGREISAGVRSVPHIEGRVLGPLLQGCCVSLHTGEVSRAAAERTGMFISRHKMFGLSSFALSQPSVFSHRDRWIGRDSVNSFLCEVLEGCNSLLKYL